LGGRNRAAAVRAREWNDGRAITRNRAPATTSRMNPGLLDGLIAAEQILRATRGAHEERPSRRNPHGTCATGSRPQGVRAHAQTPFCDLGNRRSVQRLVAGRSAAISVAARRHFGGPQTLALTAC